MKTAINPPGTPMTAGSKGTAAATLPTVCKIPGPPAPFVPTPLSNIAKSGSNFQGGTKESMHVRIFITVGFSLGLHVAACGPDVHRVLNPNHCANQSGNDWCVQRYGDARPYCDFGCSSTQGQDGCVEARPADDECYSPCGDQANISDNGGCLGEGTGTDSPLPGDSSSGTSGATEPDSADSTGTTGPMPCGSDEECTDAEAPFCGVTGECGTCDGAADPDGACRDADRLLPLCVGDACVQCTAAAPEACTGTTPVCDEATNTCVPCDAHDQCGEAACNLYTGACLPGDADAIAHVGPGQEIASLNEAVISFPGTEGTVVVHQADFNEAVTVDGGRTVAFLAADGDLPVWGLLAGGAPQLTVTAGSTVLMDGLQVSGNASGLGLQVVGGRAWVDRSRIIQNSGGGIVAEAGAELVLRNCFVTGTGNGISAIVLTDVNASILYSTMFSSAFAPTAALSCAGATNASLRNSIVVTEGGALGNEIDCAEFDSTYSATEALLPGEGNVAVGMFPDGTPEQWFSNVTIGDLGLQNEGLTLFADVAQWQTGDPPIDIDGDPRPAVDGTPDYAGADVPQ